MGIIADHLFEKVIQDSNFIYLNSVLEKHGYIEEFPVKKMVENTIKVKWFWRFGSEMKLEKVKEVK